MNRIASSIPTAMLVLVLTAAGMVSGCISGAAPATRFYTLTADVKAPLQPRSANRRPLAVEVVPFRVPQYLDRPQIVTRTGSHRLELAEFHQWGGNLRKNMTRVFVQNLAALLETTDVRIAPSRADALPHVRIEPEVLQFERCQDLRVRLSVHWVLVFTADPNLRTTRITNLQSPRIEDASDYTAMVSAMSGLLAELSDTVARAVSERTGGRSRE
jgi:uncharacterized lipoprotein YmbA